MSHYFPRLSLESVNNIAGLALPAWADVVTRYQPNDYDESVHHDDYHPSFSDAFTTSARGGKLLLLVIALFFALIQPAFAQTDETLRKLQREFNDSIAPLFAEHCTGCHSGDSADAGFNIEQFKQVDEILSDRKRWKRLEHKVQSREMPPADEPPLDEQSFNAITDWLNRMLNITDCMAINPGRVTLRRLNRTEYRNTIRDLIGVDYVPADDFPGDDVGYGFDNIADVLSLPPTLMEKYLQAAEEITERAIIDPAKMVVKEQLELASFSVQGNARVDDDAILFYSNSSAEVPLELPQNGTYRIVILAAGDQAGDEPAKISVCFRGGKKIEREVPNPRDESREYEFQLSGKQGKNRLFLSFINDFYKEGDEKGTGSSKTEDRNLLVFSVEVHGPLNVKLPDSHKELIRDKIPQADDIQIKFARNIIYGFASRAFRRSVTNDELDQLTELFKLARADGDRFEVALRFPLQAILVSPHFLFKVESPGDSAEPSNLSNYELATRLSYFLWSSMPDNELFTAAQKELLSDPKECEKQVVRMLADPKSSAFVDNFVVQWLQLQKLEGMQPDSTKFPGVDLELRNDMVQETKLLIADLVKNNQSVLNLLDAEYSFVNQRLAEHYGIRNVKGNEFQKIDTRQFGRIGLLTHASILTSTSNPARTSPVKRGKFIMENLLGEEPPPPDPAAPPIDDQKNLTGNLRQRMEQHRADPNCAVCHKTMDQLGFAFEHFDAVGRYRETDEGLPIDTNGELPDGLRFADAVDLQKTIRNELRNQFIRCFTEKMLVYATGRGMEYFDDCAIDGIIEKLKEKDYRFVELIILVATSDPFTKKKGIRMTPISRRTVLRGLGTAIALPWLEAMMPAAKLFAGNLDPQTNAPVRMAFFYVPNGIHMADWKPKKLESGGFELGPIMDPIKSFQDKINLFSGLALRNAEALGSGPGDHARSNAAFLTGAHPKKTSGKQLRNGISVDQLAAERIGHLTRLKSLELGLESSAIAGECDSGYSCAYSSNLSWRNESSPLPKEINPRVVFERLFGSESGRENKHQLAIREKRRKSILDFASQEADALSKKLGNQDRQKLDEYLYAVRDIERRLILSEKLEETEVDASNYTRPAGVPRKYEEHAKLLMDMLVLAFQTDSTRIAVFSFANEGSNRAYRDLKITDGHHEISHHGGAEEKQTMISKINRFHIELFQHFLAQIDGIREGEHTLLDNSMILYGSGISDGNRHDHHDLPIMMVGSAGGRIETGRHIRSKKRTPLTNLYCSMLEVMDVKVDSFSDSNGSVEL